MKLLSIRPRRPLHRGGLRVVHQRGVDGDLQVRPRRGGEEDPLRHGARDRDRIERAPATQTSLHLQ